MTPPTLAQQHRTHEALHYVCASCPRCRAMAPRSPEPEPEPPPPRDERPEWLRRASFNRDLTRLS